MNEREWMRVPTGNDGEVIAVVELQDGEGRTWLELRFQQEVAEIGWTTQRRIRLDAAHASSLQAALALFTTGQRDHRGRSAADTTTATVVDLEAYRRRAS